MFPSEKFYFSVATDHAGVHVILWQDKNELVRAIAGAQRSDADDKYRVHFGIRRGI